MRAKKMFILLLGFGLHIICEMMSFRASSLVSSPIHWFTHICMYAWKYVLIWDTRFVRKGTLGRPLAWCIFNEVNSRNESCIIWRSGEHSWTNRDFPRPLENVLDNICTWTFFGHLVGHPVGPHKFSSARRLKHLRKRTSIEGGWLLQKMMQSSKCSKFQWTAGFLL